MTPETIRECERMSYFAGEWKPEYDALIEILAGWSQDPDYATVAWDAALTSDMIFTQPVIYFDLKKSFADIPEGSATPSPRLVDLRFCSG